MRPTVCLLTLLLLATGGCLEDSRTEAAQDGERGGDPGDAGDDGPPLPAEEPVCRTHVNYGTHVGVEGYHVVTGGGESAVYEESNGRPGLQTETSCPSDPDRRVV